MLRPSVARKVWHYHRRGNLPFSRVWMRGWIQLNTPVYLRVMRVVRNAGGRASDDAIRSLVISHKLLGTREWFVIHHTNCGMELFTDDVIGDLLADSLETAHFDGKAWSNRKHGHGA